MALKTEQLRAVLFDYGNTLIEFTEPQIGRCDRALREALEHHFGAADHDRLVEIRNRDRRAPYSGAFHENSILEITRNLVRELFGQDPEPHVLEALLEVRFTSFVESIDAEPHVGPLLARLGERYRLGLISNYPDGEAVRASLQRVGLTEQFDAIVISGDVGRVKPHPLPFQRTLEQLDVEPRQAVYVGDNWLGDIQGAKRLGMQAVLTRQWDTPEKFDREDDHHEPDLVIDHLDALLDVL